MTTITIERELLEKIRRLTERGMSIGDRSALFNELTAILKTTPATAPAQPAWHDAPTCDGMWVNMMSGRLIVITEETLEAWQNAAVRWYGPIPEDSQ